MPGGTVGLDELHEVLGEHCSYCGSSEPVIKESLVFIQPGALHGVAMNVSIGVDLVSLPEPRQDGIAIMVDGEVGQIRIGLSRRLVVVGVGRVDGEVARRPSVGAAETTRCRLSVRTATGMIFLRAFVGRLLSTYADESVIDAPKPVMVW